MLITIDKLRKIAKCCEDQVPLDEDLAAWLAKSLGDFLDSSCKSIDEALGLKFPQGGVPWWREEAIRQRDAVLRALAGLFFADLPPSVQARQIRTLCVRYAASAWRFDQGRDEMPTHYLGTAKEMLWRAFKTNATMPIGERQLRNILAH